jgi:hypothetical protein
MVVSLGTHKNYEYTTISGDKAMMLKFKALFMVALRVVRVVNSVNFCMSS